VERERRLRKAEAEYPEVAEVLSRMTLGPVVERIQGKRLLVVSDGALQYIPFGALPEPGQIETAPMVVGHEIVYVPSASVLAELRQEPPARQQIAKLVAVLADPVFDAEDPRVKVTARGRPGRPGRPESPGAENALRGGSEKEEAEPLSSSLEKDHLTRSATEVGLVNVGGLHLPRLVFTRQEANFIFKEAPAGEGMEALDFRASREMATSISFQ